LGTGHAIQQTGEALKDFHGNILILCGDVPLLLPSTIKAMTDMHIQSCASITVLTAILNDPSGYGRIIKDNRNNVTKIVEERDASHEEKTIKEINTGIYCVKSNFLFEAINQIDNNNAQKEYYLTDIFQYARERQAKVISVIARDPQETMGINTMKDLEEANRILTEREQKICSYQELPPASP
jgi:bifunctional N-acetylglucosamine-1-phosphate-uridyltransferase/glucosamine-1-phosphate-acetyltransferase GlmU-like protein